ncbi:MAG: PKD domain-containing protein [Candidatus Dormibacter sp.]
MHRCRNLLVASATAAIVLWPGTASSAMAATAARPAATSSVPAVSPHAPFRHASIMPLLDPTPQSKTDTTFNNLDYNGGPVMPSNTDYMVLWSPSGLGAYPSGYVSGLAQYFRDLAHDNGGHQNVESTSAQYADLTGAFARYAVTFGGAIVDSNPYPTSQCPVNSPVTNCLTDAQIQQELENFVAAHHFKTDLSHEYFLLAPPHVESCFSNDPTQAYGGCSAGIVPFSGLAAFCAYHGQTTLSPMLIYAQDPFVPGNPHCDDGNHPNGVSDGELIGGLSHEHNESISDPIPNDAWTNGAGANQGQENGDQCGRQMGTPLGLAANGAKYNQVINGHFYWYQMEWSNRGHACLQRLAPPGATPKATFSVTKGGGLTLNFNASGSSVPSGVPLYVWQFNDSFGAQTVEQVIPTISHTFPSAGSYSIGLTIFAPDGSSAGTGGIVTTGLKGIRRGFTISPGNPAAGQTVTFGAMPTVSAKPVQTYLWEFGDGSTGSGAHPTHAYANKGTYAVTLVMFSGTGSAFPGDGAAPIVQQKITVH